MYDYCPRLKGQKSKSQNHVTYPHQQRCNSAMDSRINLKLHHHHHHQNAGFIVAHNNVNYCWGTLHRWKWSRRARTSGPILTIYTSYDVLPPKDVPFGGLIRTAPHFGGTISQNNSILGAWIGIFKLNVQNIKIRILSKLLHRLPPNYAQSQRPPNILRGWS